ncbi:putative uncharacterized protein DDB_G0274435 [Stomoxys calcitrans]|uniref:putative uncharacterized protein DDB_G0274435 n=1 Tax=Stomoxys calcitrans TaxID=35570 RepID=UPI0027E39725|nr:putative uncharacterized protein DDB_G0274435 [Stomoxys calcitrans]XP_059219592.1 putative uncharacterized protein DDB_G0274435 [Stomoxys calcitrans]
MKATTWLCPVLTLLCATKLVYTAQRGSYGSYHPSVEGLDSSAIQNDYFLLKRNKPSLSIVNPLDVLRQRLLLEIARRQMKENTRQVELNRAILKNVGKRMFSKHPHPLVATPEQQQQQQWEEMLSAHQAQTQLNDAGHMQRELMPTMLPYDLDLIPSALIFDYLQQRRPWLTQERTAMLFDNYDNIDVDNADENDDVNGAGADDGDMDMDVVSEVKRSLQQPMVGDGATVGASEGPHETTLKKPINRSGHEGGSSSFGAKSLLYSLKHQHKTFNNDFKLNDLATLGLGEDSNAAAANTNSNNSNDNNNNKNGINDDNQVQRYLYHLHKNHLTRK